MDDTTKKPFWTEARKAAFERSKEARMQGLLKAQEANRGPASAKRLAALQRLADARRGIPLSEEKKQKDRDALLQKYAEDPEFRERQRQASTEANMSLEMRRKNSEGVRRVQSTPEYKQNHKEAMARPEVREALAKGQRGRVHTEEHNRKTSETAITGGIRKAQWALVSFEERQRHTMPGRIASQEANTSSLEIQVKTLLDALGVDYIQQYQIDTVLVDFYIPARHLVLEVNGCYWHQCEVCGHPDLGKRQSDRNRAYFIRSQGYTLYTLWEHDMNDVNSKGMIGLMSRLEGSP